ncbi:MAG: hypothetical protein GX759_01520 [Thermoanaerobacterales bacterium]|nr:hypothetical protein [Thermoanaerobacterales bacterium]
MAHLDKVMKDLEKAGEKLAEMLNEKEEPIPDTESEFATEEEELSDVQEMGEYDESSTSFKEVEIRECECDESDGNESTPPPCSRIARFNCIRPIPDGLKLDRVKDFRVAYDPTNLRVCVEETSISVAPPPGCPDLTLTVFAVRVVGCIPVSISALAFKSRCGVNLVHKRSDDKKVALCCDTTVCVDNIICYRGNRAQAEAAAAAIERQLKGKFLKPQGELTMDDSEIQHRPDPCDAVSLLFVVGRIFRVPIDTVVDKPKILVFSGAFKLPNCPPVNTIV